MTGGPSAGKTKVLNAVKNNLENLGYRVFTVSETARILLKDENNKDYNKDYNDIKTFQDYMLKLQHLREDIIDELAKNSKCEKAIIIYDRGIFDNRAYLNSYKDFDDIMKKNNLSEIDALEKYDLVIDLISVASMFKDKYQNDSERLEDTETANKLDIKTTTAWLAHRNLKLIKPTLNIDNKIDIAMNLVLDLLQNKKYNNEEVIPITSEAYQKQLNLLNKENYVRIETNNYSLTNLVSNNMNYNIIQKTLNGKEKFFMESYNVNDNDNELYNYKIKIITKEQYEKLLTSYIIQKITNTKDIIYRDGFKINKLRLLNDTDYKVVYEEPINELYEENEKVFVKK